jgi:hypothetical protein
MAEKKQKYRTKITAQLSEQSLELLSASKEARRILTFIFAFLTRGSLTKNQIFEKPK